VAKPNSQVNCVLLPSVAQTAQLIVVFLFVVVLTIVAADRGIPSTAGLVGAATALAARTTMRHR